MYDNRRLRFFPSQPEIDIHQIIGEAQTRWLRPLEVIEILRNYQKFRLNPVPPNKPPNGSLFLFDRKTLRFFRKDGHNWRKKKDGKTVREAHERLKAGSVDVLHCYYAHGEDNPNFQRRSYWMLEGAYEHIVLVHYREVTEGSRSSVYRSMQEAKDNASQSTSGRPAAQVLPSNGPEVEVTGPYKSPEATLTPLGSEDTDSGDEECAENPTSTVVDQSSLLQQVSRPTVKDAGPSGSSLLPQQPGLDNVDFDDLLRNPDAYLGQNSISPAVTLDVTAWNTLLENFKAGGPSDNTASMAQPANHMANGNGTQNLIPKQEAQHMEVDSRSLQVQHTPKQEYQNTQNILLSEDCYRVPPPPDTSIQEEGKNMKKLDSFGRWMSREIGEDDQSSLLSGSTDHGAYWTLDDHNTFDEISSFSQQMHLDVGLGPSLSQEQQFSIVDFSPDWAFSLEETKVIITGNFLRANPNTMWHCMFGEVEVPAEIIHEGVLRCKAPAHSPGRVPFYITRGNRTACSEIREFEYRVLTLKSTPSSDPLGTEDAILQLRFAKLISLCADEATNLQYCDKSKSSKIQELTSDFDKKWTDIEQNLNEDKDTQRTVLEMLLRKQLERWLLTKICENEKAASVLDVHGQCVLHLAAALGYDWAIFPILVAGIGINFRDVHGWTALHWAASRGREKVVSTLLAAGASPGLVTDPTPQYSSGRTPADLAASSGHKGMAGLLAEMSLTSHLTQLNLKERSANEIDSISAVLAEEKAVSDSGGIDQAAKGEEQTLLQGSLRAVRNAARAAALIHATFRQESFRRRQEKLGEEVDEYGLSMNEIKAMTSLQADHRHRKEHHLHSAATKIQQKYRGWKGRKDFLLLRQRVVRIQAHVRGHQVRRKFKNLLWTVGIVEKAVLRWRRKRSGLRNFRAPTEATQNSDDDEVLKAGRKQKEVQIQKAVTRVQSMVRSHQAREQYQRIQEAYLQAVAGDTQAQTEDESMLTPGE